MNGFPVTIATNGKGIPVVYSTNGAPATLATNGKGMPIVIATNGNGIPLNIAGYTPPPPP